MIGLDKDTAEPVAGMVRTVGAVDDVRALTAPRVAG